MRNRSDKVSKSLVQLLEKKQCTRRVFKNLSLIIEMAGTVIQKRLTAFGIAGPADGNTGTVFQEKCLMLHGADVVGVYEKTLMTLNELYCYLFRKTCKGSIALNAFVPQPKTQFPVKALHAQHFSKIDKLGGTLNLDGKERRFRRNPFQCLVQRTFEIFLFHRFLEEIDMVCLIHIGDVFHVPGDENDRCFGTGGKQFSCQSNTGFVGAVKLDVHQCDPGRFFFAILPQFLGRMTNLFDGVSFVIEANNGQSAGGSGVSEEEVKGLIANALKDFAAGLLAE